MDRLDLRVKVIFILLGLAGSLSGQSFTLNFALSRVQTLFAAVGGNSLVLELIGGTSSWLLIGLLWVSDV